MPVERHDVLVIGGGAAGLAAASELSTQRIDVAVLEARQRLGGRILTRRAKECDAIELGAEFVHGDAPEVVAIANAARLELVDVDSAQLWARGGHLTRSSELDRALSKAMGEAAEAGRRGPDRSFAQALEAAGVREPGRSLALHFVEGFQAAHADRISARALPAGNIASARTRRMPAGYDGIVGALAGGNEKSMHLDHVAQVVTWRRGEVEVSVSRERSMSGETTSFRSRCAIVAVPPTVLATSKARASSPRGLRFEPALRGKTALLRTLAPGHAVRLVLTFAQPFWREAVGSHRDAFFHMPGAAFPTSWTAPAGRSHRLTAWAGGPAAEALHGLSVSALAERALDVLAVAFPIRRAELESLLRDAETHAWESDPFALESYSYPLVGGARSGPELAEPIDGTLFFAGEFTCAPPENGTVEGAIASGLRAAREVMMSLAADRRAGVHRDRHPH